jgi:hypothetical protein
MKNILAVLVLLAGAGLATGCVVPVSGHVQYEGPAAEFGYTPVLFSGYVVYYADGGVPFIWLNGAQFWIPTAERHYYEAYYRQYSGEYSAWYRRHGDSHRGHRYTNQAADGRRLRRADDRGRVPTPALQPADDRGRVAQPVLRPAPEVQPQPKASPEPEPKATPKLEVAPEPKPKKKPKLTKKDD